MSKHLIKIDNTQHVALSVAHAGKDNQYCEAGEVVAIDWQPSSGWGLQEAHYTDEDENVVSIDLSVREFTMPAKAIVVSGTAKRFVVEDWKGYEPNPTYEGTAGNVMQSDGNGGIVANANVSVSAEGTVSAEGDVSAEGNVSAKGNVSAEGNVYADRDVSAKGNVSAEGDVSADRDVYAKGTVSAEGDVSAEGNVSAKGNVSAEGNVSADRDVYAKGNVIVGDESEKYIKMWDANGVAWFIRVDPHGNLTVTNS